MQLDRAEKSLRQLEEELANLRQTHTLYKNKVQDVAAAFENDHICSVLNIRWYETWFVLLQVSMELEQKEGETTQLNERLGDLQRR